ncbi:MAG: response regulator [Gammaproteobacteria bacterium]|nr:response regulator [Gammaproteobacteria bacterium]
MKTHFLNIRMKIILLACLPVIAISLVLSVHMVQTRMNDIFQSLLKQGQLIAHNLAPVCELGLFAGDNELLQRLADNTLRDPIVKSVSIVSADRRVHLQVFASRSESISMTGPVLKTPHTLLFTEPVYQTGTPIDEYVGGLQKNAVIGWVKVEISQDEAIRKRKEILENGLSIGVLGALVSILIGLRLEKGISKPILNLTGAMERMQAGDLDARAEGHAKGELGQLQRGFNELADVISASQQDLTKQVDDATERLRRNLIELAKKNIELDQARKKAIELGDEKSSFLFNMSHEIRTPLNAVLGYNSLLEKTELDQQQKEYAQIVHQASKQLLSVIDDILSYARLESGKVILEEVPFDLLKCCEDVMALMTPLAAEKELDFALILTSQFPETVLGDPNRLTQILTNLVSNAIKFTELGHVSVEIGIDETRDEPTLRIAVRDTGIGMSQEAQSNIFEQFQQGDNTITRRFGGTGLGLAIVSRLARLMDAHIDVASTEGRGTTFTFRLPLSVPDGAPAKAKSDDALTGTRCLLYDSSEIERQAVTALLRLWKVEAIQAAHLDTVIPTLDAEIRSGRRVDFVFGGLRLRQNDIDDLASAVGTLRKHYQGPVMLLLTHEKQAKDPRLNVDDRITPICRPIRHRLMYEQIRAMMQPETQPKPGPSKAPLAKRSPPIRGLRILLAEDNDLNRRLLTTLADQKGATVISAHDGQHAMSIACAEPLDLILLDLHLPELDGIELARQIRGLSGSMGQVPIIALTADIYRGKKDNLKNAGFNGCVFKPIDEASLWDCVGDALKGIDSPRCWPGQDDPKAFRETRVRAKERERKGASGYPSGLLPELEQQFVVGRQAIADAIGNDDRVKILKHSHDISGVAGIFGHTRIAMAAAEIEGAVHREAKLADISRLFEELDAAFEDLGVTG